MGWANLRQKIDDYNFGLGLNFRDDPLLLGDLGPNISCPKLGHSRDQSYLKIK